jgi:hypothetical protein
MCVLYSAQNVNLILSELWHQDACDTRGRDMQHASENNKLINVLP